MKTDLDKFAIVAMTICSAMVQPVFAQTQMDGQTPPQMAPADAIDDTTSAPPFAPPVQTYQPPMQSFAPYYGNAEYRANPQGAYVPGQSWGYRQYSPYIPPYNRYGVNTNYQAPRPYTLAARVAYAPAGLVLPVTLRTAISTQVAHVGDYVEADLSQNVPLNGFAYIPAGSALVGEVSNAEGGRMFGRSGLLSMKFSELRLPDGRQIPIDAHILGNIAKYAQKNGEVRGEGWGTKLGGLALRGAIGAAGGAVFGTALGAIASHGMGVGTGAWAGTAIGGGLGVVDDLVLRRGRNVLIHAGTAMQVQLDEPIEVPVEFRNQTGNS